MKSVDAKRAEIEALAKSITPTEIATNGFRAKIAQKWAKLHVYAQKGQVVRIKTYPHEGVSKRTEEFYFDDGQLILATIEDDGTGEAGKAKENIDKMYYYQNGEFVTELKSSGEKEYSINKSEAEELLQEANEYLDAFNAQK